MNLKAYEELKKRYKCPIWQTKAGELVPLTIMNQYHMLNAYKMVLREIAEYDYAYSMLYSPTWGPDPDSMAFDAAEREMERYEVEYRPVLTYWKDAFEQEFLRRNLDRPAPPKIEKFPKIKKMEIIDIGGGTARILELDKEKE